MCYHQNHVPVLLVGSERLHENIMICSCININFMANLPCQVTKPYCCGGSRNGLLSIEGKGKKGASGKIMYFLSMFTHLMICIKYVALQA